MTFDITRDVLFIGKGIGGPCYYRVMLPAMALGADWIGLTGEPPTVQWNTGLAKDEDGVPQSAMPDLFKYKIVVIQQPASDGWVKLIRGLREQGIAVLYETDDYLHGIRKMSDHDGHDYFDRAYLRQAEACMAAATGIIGSTDYIVGRYADFNRRTFLCRNGLDLGRYDLTIPARDSFNVGWAGSTGHVKTLIPWLQQVAKIMQMRGDVNFVSIGENFADGMRQPLGPFPRERALPIPWAAIEQYPAAMTMFDATLAPSGPGEWWAGKSDLRWLEAGALGIPAIVDPKLYPESVHGQTAMQARSPQEVFESLYVLVNNPELRETISTNVREHVREKRSMTVMREQWREVFESLASEKVASEATSA